MARDKQYTTDETLIREALNRIVCDEKFATSRRYVDLITYLTEKTLRGEYLKEYTIRSEFFHKEDDSENTDSIVRVHMHNLRKRLTLYYLESGIEDDIRFEFDKRSYNMRFRIASIKRPINKRVIIAAAFAMLIVTTSTITTYNHINRYYFWETFLDNSVPTKMILADHIMIATVLDGKTITLSHQDINTADEYREHITKQNIDTTYLSKFTFYSQSIALATHKLARLYQDYNHDFTHIPETKFQLSDTKNANIIYIGQLKTMDRSQMIFLKDSKLFSNDRYNFYITREDGLTESFVSRYLAHGPQMEYGMVSYTQLTSGYRALYIVANNDIGITAALNYFTDRESLAKFYSHLSSEQSYFNVLFKAAGADRTDAEIEIIEIEEIVH